MVAERNLLQASKVHTDLSRIQVRLYAGFYDDGAGGVLEAELAEDLCRAFPFLVPRSELDECESCLADMTADCGRALNEIRHLRGD